MTTPEPSLIAPHVTCIESTSRQDLAMGLRTWICGRDCPPYVPVPVGPDPARDERVAERRAVDARKATIALDSMLGAAQREADRVYDKGWRDGYSASEVHHNGHYGVPACPACRSTDPAVRNHPAGFLCDDPSGFHTIKPNYGVTDHDG